MKQILYMLYAMMFYMYRLLPINKNKTTFIMTHDESINGNIMRMYQKIKAERPHELCKFVTKKGFKEEKGWRLFIKEVEFVCKSSFHLATSQAIFLDNVFLPMAFMRFKKQVKIVQLWHGCNTLKKFGQLSNVGQLKKLEKKANSHYTHLITSSKKMNKLHMEAFGVAEDKIYALGLPRMDSLFQDETVLQREKDVFYKDYPQLKGKTLILYAPTFRDNDLEITNDNMDLTQVAEVLSEEYVIMTKFHPFVAQNYRSVQEYKLGYKAIQDDKLIEEGKLVDVSHYDDLNRLLLVADILVTDYSSIIFEYAILKKPMIFYAYDQAEYGNKIRGFYYDYNNYVPGVIVRKREELIRCIQDKVYLQYSYEGFINEYLEYKDANAAQRIYEAVYKSI